MFAGSAGVRTVAAIPAAGLLAGAAAGLLLSDSSWGPALAGPPVLLLASIAAAIVCYCLRAGARSAFVLSIALGFACGGFLLAASAWQRAWRPPLRAMFEEMARDQRREAEAEGRRMPEDDEAFAIVEGILRADASPGDAGVSLTLDIDRLNGAEAVHRLAHPEHVEGRARSGQGGIAVTVVGSLAASKLGEWRAGRRVRMPVALRRPSRYLNAGVPDHERALARRGISLVGTVKSGTLVDLVERGSLLDETVGAVRAFARRAIALAVGRWSPQSAAIVAAIVIGDRAGLDDRVQERLQEAGTYHVIAISGGNIAILAGVLVGVFRMGGWLGRTAMLSAIVLLGAYAHLVGGGASVDRATLMAAVHFAARAFDHRTPPLNTLAVVVTVLVAADPLAVADPAFLLTFGATLGILHAPDSSLLSAGRPMLRLIAGMFVASMAAELLLFPIAALVFSRVTFAGLFLNFLAIPLMAVAQIAGMLLVPIALASPSAAALVGWVAHLGATGLVQSAEVVRFTPMLSYRVAPPSCLVVVCYYVALAAWWGLRWRRADCGSADAPLVDRIRRTAAAVAGAAAMWILLDPRTLVAARGDGRLHATFIDVGQGDAAFVVFPRGSTLLVDAGGLSGSASFDIGDRVVAPVIRGAGFSRLDYVALTHGDPDHVGGAASVLEEFRPREVWEGIPVPRSAPLAALRRQTGESGARWRRVYAGERLVIDEVDIIAWHPGVEDWERQKVRNDDSLVLELRWRDVSVLLTGDIGRWVERELGPAIAPAKLRVVKIPHHGSLTSSSEAFVRALRPSIAVVSAGRANHFGHPVPEVLDRYRAAGAQVFRTDRDGAVMIDSDGASFEVRTFAQRRYAPP